MPRRINFKRLIRNLQETLDILSRLDEMQSRHLHSDEKKRPKRRRTMPNEPASLGIGVKLKDFRVRRHLGSEQVAKRLGIRLNTLQTLEQGRTPTRWEYVRIKKHFPALVKAA